MGRLQLMGSAGFRVVLNYSMLAQSSPQQIIAYVRAAAANGLQVIWPLHEASYQNPWGNFMVIAYPQLTLACGCLTNQAVADYIVSLARGEPNTWGYYLADEPDPSTHARIKAFAARVQTLDPNHSQLIVGNGFYPVSQALAPFTDVNTMLADDMYPVRTQGPDPTYAYNATANVMQDVQSLADSAGRNSAIVLQAFSWGDTVDTLCGASPSNCRFPTEQEMGMQRLAAEQNGRPQLILWFALFDVIGFPAGERPSSWSAPISYAGRWDALVHAAFGTPVVSASLPTSHPVRHTRRCHAVKHPHRRHRNEKAARSRRSCIKHRRHHKRHPESRRSRHRLIHGEYRRSSWQDLSL